MYKSSYNRLLIYIYIYIFSIISSAFPLITSFMVNLDLMAMCEMLTLPCIAIWFQIFSCICSLQQVPFNNAAAEMCSLRMWQWQMSNYRSDIHVSHLRPTRPAISPTDAECEMRALSLSTEPTRKAALPVLACHPSLVPLGCHSCVTVPLLRDR